MKELKKRKIAAAVESLLFDDEIIVIHGSRQVGKTSLLKYLIRNLPGEKVSPGNIVYMDLEDFVLLDICSKGVDNTVKYLKSVGCDFTKRIFLFIDEIQYLDNPSSFLKLFHDRYASQVKLVVSGSSSFAIKSKFKDSLVGRTFNFELFGLDFEEFLWFKDAGYDLRQPLPGSLHPVLKEFYSEYVLFGSYPKVVLTESIDKKELILKQIIGTYIKKDIFDLANIKNIKKFNDLIVVLAGQSSGLLNINELANTLRLARDTVEKYLFILENTYITRQINPFSKNIRIELTKMPEVFMEDTGLMNLLTHKTFSREISGPLFETGIFSLLRRNANVENIFFWRTTRKHEIDFIYEPKLGEVFALEVKKRFRKAKLTALEYFRKEYPDAHFFVVTLDKLVAAPQGVEVIYPWEMYRRIFCSG